MNVKKTRFTVSFFNFRFPPLINTFKPMSKLKNNNQNIEKLKVQNIKSPRTIRIRQKIINKCQPKSILTESHLFRLK